MLVNHDCISLSRLYMEIILGVEIKRIMLVNHECISLSRLHLEIRLGVEIKPIIPSVELFWSPLKEKLIFVTHFAYNCT